MTNLTTLLFFGCLLLATKFSFSQASNATNSPGGSAYLGWSGSLAPLYFKFGSGSTGPALITITPNGAGTAADLAVTGSITSGNTINIPATGAYQIGGAPILSGSSTQLFCGIGAGVAGSNPTFIGAGAGSTNTGSQSPTYVGHNAGFSDRKGDYNTFVGAESGYNATTTTGPPAYVSDNNNSFFGYRSGWSLYQGSGNTLLGCNTDLITANPGAAALINYTSSLGTNAKVGGDFATAIGAYTITPKDHTMLLGSRYGTTGSYDFIKIGVGLSADVNGPLNYLEINADPNSFNSTSNVYAYNSSLNSGKGLSGLTFRQLTSANTPSSSATGKVLSVNNSGEVILVNDPVTAAQNGTFINGSLVELGTNPLLHNTQIPMVNGTGGAANEWSIYFTGQTTMANTTHNPVAMALGYTFGSQLRSKFNSLNNVQVYSSGYPALSSAGDFNSNGFTNPATISSYSGVMGSSSVTAATIAATTNSNIGGNFTGNNGKQSYGVYAISNTTSTIPSSVAYGTYSSASGGTSNYGVFGKVNGSSTSASTNYAIFGDAGGTIGAGTNYYSGYFNGKSHCTSTFTSTSDSIFKENVHPLTGDSALFIITHLAAKTYVFDSIDYPTIHLPRGGQYGLIAQQVERVAPTLVSEIQHPAFYDTLGHIIDSAITYKALNYTGLIPILVAAVKLLSTHASTTDNGVSIGSSNDIELGGTALKHTTEIPMIDPASDKEYNIYFSGQSSMHNAKANIGIGYDTTYALEAKLDVISHTDQYSENNFTNTYTGRFLNEGIYRSTANKDFIAVYGKTDIDKADSKVANTNIGGDFIARNGNVNIGVRGSTDGTYKPNTTNYGVYGESMDTVNYWAGYFNGFIGTTAGWVQASDRRLKQDIQVISKTSSMELINKLHPKTYRFNAASAKGMNMPNGKQYGLIADEVKKELPELVKAMSTPAKYDAKGKLINEEQHFEGVNYSAIIPLLIAAVQSLDSTNKELRSELKDLRNCCGYSTSVTPTNKGNHTSLELADLAIILDQNSPNPFAEQTIITYTIPETVSTAKLVFYTSSGIVMKEYTMQEKGSGSMTVYASNLSAGIYSYSLIADGKLIATKKIICEKR